MEGRVLLALVDSGLHTSRSSSRFMCFVCVDLGTILNRHWRTEAGAAELRREGDRIRGAGIALDLTLRAWSATVGAATMKGAMLPSSLLRRKIAEVVLFMRFLA